ncbi:Pentatricopeptide repeat-containing protein At2g31400 [Durusdinium trenchii]|uniref:Chloroplastic n=1 Tax=Durusdinium trenchii TaxID=1381693 RepID=A0ABP0I9E2_9DINO
MERSCALSRAQDQDDIKLYGKKAKELARQSHWGFVLSLLTDLATRDLKLKLGVPNGFNSAIVAISATSATSTWAKALHLASHMGQHRTLPDVVTWSGVLTSSTWQHGLGILRTLRLLRLERDLIALSSAIAACERDHRWSSAVCLLHLSHEVSVRPNHVSYNSSISACEKAGRWLQAVSLLGDLQLQRWADVVSYNSAISACEKSDRWDVAIELLLSLQKGKLIPDLVSYSAVISAAEKGGQWALALFLLTLLESDGRDGRDRRDSPDVVIYSSVISACEKGRQWQRALQVLWRMEVLQIRPNVISFNAAISACEKAGQAEAAVQALEMLRRTTQPDVVSFSAVIKAQATVSHHWRRSVELLRDMKVREILPNLLTFNSVVDALGISSAWTQSLLLLEDLRKRRHQPDMITFAGSVNACARALCRGHTVQLLGGIDQRRVAGAVRRKSSRSVRSRSVPDI